MAVFGCGGVGDAAIAGAKLAGATTIVGVDLDDRKLDVGPGFGATHTVNASTDDPVEAVRAATGGFGADVCIEAVGHPDGARAGVLSPATWPAPWCRWACPRPTCASPTSR